MWCKNPQPPKTGDGRSIHSAISYGWVIGWYGGEVVEYRVLVGCGVVWCGVVWCRVWLVGAEFR